jgi:hypothetical protein
MDLAGAAVQDRAFEPQVVVSEERDPDLGLQFCRILLRVAEAPVTDLLATGALVLSVL